MAGFVDKRTGKWIKGFECVHRSRNRRGYQQRKYGAPDLRDKLSDNHDVPRSQAEESDIRQKLTRRNGVGDERVLGSRCKEDVTRRKFFADYDHPMARKPEREFFAGNSCYAMKESEDVKQLKTLFQNMEKKFEEREGEEKRWRERREKEEEWWRNELKEDRERNKREREEDRETNKKMREILMENSKCYQELARHVCQIKKKKKKNVK